MEASYVSAADMIPANGAPADKAAPQGDWPTFHEVLSALNPLQYVPVVGTIYRALTGDTIPEALRIAGSFVVSALTGGPIGMALNAATIIAEKVTGIDPEVIARDLLGAAPEPKAAASAAPPTPIHEAGTPVANSTPSTDSNPWTNSKSWTVSQIAAYASDAFRPPTLPPPEPIRPRSQAQMSHIQHLAAIASYRRSLLT